jgi:hypothetical protein
VRTCVQGDGASTSCGSPRYFTDSWAWP